MHAFPAGSAYRPIDIPLHIASSAREQACRISLISASFRNLTLTRQPLSSDVNLPMARALMQSCSISKTRRSTVMALRCALTPPPLFFTACFSLFLKPCIAGALNFSRS
jgi:hypothetical protein